MKDLRDYQEILMEDYPDIWQMWCDAVNADFRGEELYQEGKFEEAIEQWKIHEDKWEEYEFAAKLVL